MLGLRVLIEHKYTGQHLNVDAARESMSSVFVGDFNESGFMKGLRIDQVPITSD